MAKKQTSRYNRIQRTEMMRKIEARTDLDYDTPHLQSAHAVAHRGSMDWKAVAKAMGRESFHGAPPVTVDSLGEIVIVVDDGSLTLNSNSGELNYPAVWDHVRNAYGDNFDFLTFFTDFSVPFGYSFWSPIYFDTQGISYQAYDFRQDWNTGRLQGFHFINPGHLNIMGVYLQEFGHQWGSYVYFADSHNSPYVYTNLLLDGEPGHWDFYMNDAHSPMNYDFWFTPDMSTHWEQRPGDPSIFDYHATERIEYCDLDLYLMGLLPPEDVRPFYFIANPQPVGPQAWTGQRRDVSLEMVINAMGPRQAPAGLRENDYRDAWILVTRSRRHGEMTAARLDGIRQDFALRYHVATRCLGRIDTTLP